ncbi:ABC transporter permease [Enterocloster asparagiformis]|uniref:MacB-like periplasmic core domain-containing protein n=2 Tax=Enterocloster asparagiformis TaxID=333367 RepID=C0CZL9_9FIRM|nr:ABC transporter permease [Enterocloster asparagiformis]EEG55468.1 hypothetical protein CLOSTASPAR_02446 [[Clostridium] asparagiforme DSM 15981]RGX30999.1 hypothetical protein DWV29_07490 [Enterocloster asparagiformis]UWO75755.1 ABC transporter permease [[Clostridium] asparagiforme DSM 15981]
MKRWLIILLAAGFCIAAMLRWRELKDFGSQIFYEYGEADAPDGELFDRMAEAERSQGNPLPDMAAWTVEENVEVENRSLGRVQKADRMLVWGDRELAVKRGLAAGNYGYPSDPRACVISRGLAMELFGSYAVVGMEVRCQGTDYLVRGVTQDDRRMVIVPASGSSDRFPYVLLDYGADRGAKSGADQLLYRYDAGSARYRVDGEICLSVAGFFAFLPVWAALGRSLFEYFVREKRLLHRLAAVSAAAVAAAACIRILGAEETRFPPDLIPSRWSDFSFWGQRWREIAPALRFAGENGRVLWMTLLRERTTAGILCGTAGGLTVICNRSDGGIVRKTLLTLRDKMSKVGGRSKSG